MKNLKILFNTFLPFVLIAAMLVMMTSCNEGQKTETSTPAKTKTVAAKKYKMTTQIPENVITPDVVETSIGTLKFNDGFPTEETAQKVWDNLDFVRAVEAMIMTTPAASLVRVP